MSATAELVDHLQKYHQGRANAVTQEALARTLGMDKRTLQDLLSEAAAHNGHVGSCAQGVYYSVSVEDHRAAYKYLIGRFRPLRERVTAIEAACPQVATERMF